MLNNHTQKIQASKYTQINLNPEFNPGSHQGATSRMVGVKNRVAGGSRNILYKPHLDKIKELIKFINLMNDTNFDKRSTVTFTASYVLT